jgi:O-antigen ligase
MTSKILNKKIVLVFLFLWIFLISTINVYPHNLLNFNTLLDFVHTLRIWMPILFGIIVFFLFIPKLKKKERNFINYYHYLSIFTVIFLLQLIGAFFSERINFQTIYVLIFCFITLGMFALIEHLQLQKLYKFFLHILIFLIGLAALFFFYLFYDQLILSFKTGNLYSVFWSPDIQLFGQAPPRVTGFSRMIAIISLFLIFLIEHSIKKNIFIIIVNILLGMIIWFAQSRGTLLCYYLSILIIIFILNINDYWLRKIKKIFLYILIPVIISIISNYLYFFSKNSFKNKIDIRSTITIDGESIDEIYDYKNTRVLSNKTGTSGRFSLWKISINDYDKIKLFGYGPQADRIIINNYYVEKLNLRNPYGNNVSNGLIYTFLSGGYLAAILFFCLYVKNLFITWTFVKIIKKSKKVDSIYKFSFILIIFFSIRSLVENSYAIWSLDFLLMLISMALLNHFLVKKSS